jgi:hypothetical protein
LTGGLSFGNLSIVNDESQNLAIIQDATNNNVAIALLNNVDASDLTADHFI